MATAKYARRRGTPPGWRPPLYYRVLDGGDDLRESDRAYLAELEQACRTGEFSNELRFTGTRVLRRIRLDAYPKAKKGARTKAARNFWLVVIYLLQRTHDPLAANHVATFARQHGLRLSSQSIPRMARGDHLGTAARELIGDYDPDGTGTEALIALAKKEFAKFAEETA